jgi:hypothetical protein
MIRHAYPTQAATRKDWVPAFAGMSGTYCFGLDGRAVRPLSSLTDRPDPIIPYNARQ